MSGFPFFTLIDHRSYGSQESVDAISSRMNLFFSRETNATEPAWLVRVSDVEYGEKIGNGGL